MAHGGEAVARVDGKTWFVAGAMPGERVLGDISVDKGAWGRVELRSVEDPSPHRVRPPCTHFGTCGGCHWQFADHATQLDWKRSIVAGQLRHLGRLADPDVRATVAPSGPYGYRNRMDFSVDGGRPALFRGRSRSLVPIDHCWLLEPALAGLFDRLGPLDGVERLTVRVGAATGAALVVLTGEVPAQAADWGASVVRRHHDGYEAILGDPWISRRGDRPPLPDQRRCLLPELDAGGGSAGSAGTRRVAAGRRRRAARRLCRRRVVQRRPGRLGGTGGGGREQPAGSRRPALQHRRQGQCRGGEVPDGAAPAR